jgi:glycosyltransferase involved in cell wall biosynthesis
MTVFRRGIDTDLFSPVPGAREKLEKQFEIEEGVILLYTGRVSRDKSLDFLVDVYGELLKKHRTAALLVVDDGPYLAEMKMKMKMKRKRQRS